MFRIIDKVVLNPYMTKMVIAAPLVAQKALPGQFIILRLDEFGERIPLTISDYDRKQGSVTIIYQKVGRTTMLLDTLQIGDCILDFVGPLGKASNLNNYKNVAVIGGGTGCAIAYPQAKFLFNSHADVDIIAGFRNKDLIILKNEMSKVCNNLFIVTDDGSNGVKGFVTNILLQQLNNKKNYDLVIAIGPIPMMKAVCDITREHNIKTIVSMSSIMIDGTGMCGGCRLTVDGKTKFACIDGPDFDGHKVDFDEAMTRLSIYNKNEKIDREKNCRLLGGCSHES